MPPPMSALTGSPPGPMRASRHCRTRAVCLRHASRKRRLTSQSGVAPSPRRLHTARYCLRAHRAARRHGHRGRSAAPLCLPEFFGVSGGVQMGHVFVARPAGLRPDHPRSRGATSIATRNVCRSDDLDWRHAAAQTAPREQLRGDLGGDELSVPTKELRPVYEQAAALGLHRLIHAGEIGGPEKIREAVELLGAERIGHGIAAINDPALMDLLADRRIPIVLCTDDPAMFHTTLLNEYEHAHQLGMTENELLRLAQMSFDFAFERKNSRTAV